MNTQINYQGKRLVGIDEVGRGPLAGPVVAAAVILKEPIPGLADSKKLTEKKRLDLVNKIKDQALCFGVGRVTPAEIDEINILQASLLAMQRAVDELPILPEYGAVDGTHLPQLSFPCQAVIKGDSLIPAISAASILAKVIRDQEMIEMDSLYPGYGFAKHKGYPTKTHREALISLGISPIHRLSFAPVRRVLDLSQEPA